MGIKYKIYIYIHPPRHHNGCGVTPGKLPPTSSIHHNGCGATHRTGHPPPPPPRGEPQRIRSYTGRTPNPYRPHSTRVLGCQREPFLKKTVILRMTCFWYPKKVITLFIQKASVLGWQQRPFSSQCHIENDLLLVSKESQYAFYTKSKFAGVATTSFFKSRSYISRMTCFWYPKKTFSQTQIILNMACFWHPKKQSCMHMQCHSKNLNTGAKLHRHITCPFSSSRTPTNNAVSAAERWRR